MRLADKTAIVTGGANGIGRATCLLFAREGAFVVVADRDTRDGPECVESIRAAGGCAARDGPRTWRTRSSSWPRTRPATSAAKT